jgi:hypothetical protein
MKVGIFLTSLIARCVTSEGNHNEACQFCVADYRSSKLYKDDPDGVLAILEKQNVTFNSHYWCITEEVITLLPRFDSGNIQLIAITIISLGESLPYPPLVSPPPPVFVIFSFPSFPAFLPLISGI